VLGNSTKILVDQKNSASLLNLPFDKLLQQAGTAAATTQPQGDTSGRVTTTEPTVSIDPSRSREGLRNRDAR
jgi:hypothetical protein